LNARARLPSSGSNLYGREKKYTIRRPRKSNIETQASRLIQRLFQGSEEEEEEDGKKRQQFNGRRELK